MKHKKYFKNCKNEKPEKYMPSENETFHLLFRNIFLNKKAEH